MKQINSVILTFILAIGITFIETKKVEAFGRDNVLGLTGCAVGLPMLTIGLYHGLKFVGLNVELLILNTLFKNKYPAETLSITTKIKNSSKSFFETGLPNIYYGTFISALGYRLWKTGK